MWLHEGDGTVPLVSSKAVSIDSSRTYYFKGIEHATMPSATGIKSLVNNIITGNMLSLPSNATQDSSVCKVTGELVSVHSPVNLHIYDSSGNHVGRGENGEIDYNITGVAYEEIGEILGKPVNTVGTLISRAKRSLSQSLKGKELPF